MRYAYTHTHIHSHTLPFALAHWLHAVLGQLKLVERAVKCICLNLCLSRLQRNEKWFGSCQKWVDSQPQQQQQQLQHVSDTKNEEEEQLQRQLLVKCAVNARNMMINESKESERERERERENDPRVRPVGEKNSRNIYGKVNCSQQGQLWSPTKPQQLP